MGRSTLHRGSEIGYNAGEIATRAADAKNTLDDVGGSDLSPNH